jgi:hypothetical protein
MTATGSGYLVPDPPLVPANAEVVEHAAGATLTVASFGKIHTNTGDSDSQELTLPAAADAAGMSLKAQLTVAQDVVLVPASGEAIYLGGSGTDDEKLNIAGVIGNYADIFCDGERYHVFDYSGVLTKTT